MKMESPSFHFLYWHIQMFFSCFVSLYNLNLKLLPLPPFLFQVRLKCKKRKLDSEIKLVWFNNYTVHRVFVRVHPLIISFQIDAYLALRATRDLGPTIYSQIISYKLKFIYRSQSNWERIWRNKWNTINDNLTLLFVNSRTTNYN